MNCGYCPRELDINEFISLVDTSWIHYECSLEVMAKMMAGEFVELRDNMDEYSRLRSEQ